MRSNRHCLNTENTYKQNAINNGCRKQNVINVWNNKRKCNEPLSIK